MAIILVVDDELGIRALLSEILADEGHTIELAENAAQARACRERLRPDLVLLDIWMPDVDGITLLKEWATTAQLTMPVIMMSGHGTIDTAVEATKFGAMAFLEKPITLQKLLRAVEQGLAKPASRAAPPPNSAHHAGHESGLTVESATFSAPRSRPARWCGPRRQGFRTAGRGCPVRRRQQEWWPWVLSARRLRLGCRADLGEEGCRPPGRILRMITRLAHPAPRRPRRRRRRARRGWRSAAARHARRRSS